MATKQKIAPFLWLDDQAEEAANFYTSIFKNSEVGKVFRQDDKVLTIEFQLDGQEFSALNGGPFFKLNPSISFYTVCETEAEVDSVWQRLGDGGQVLMPLDKYPWSEKYGWLNDKYGVSWQIALGKMEEVGQKFTPFLTFTGSQHGRAEEALNLYTSIFKNSSVAGIMRYGPGETEREGTVTHAQFSLDGGVFMVIDSGAEHGFQFNEALSFVINCEGQAEVDYYWEKLIADGGQESQCGWLKDKFGVSWQVVPVELHQLLADPDPARAQRATGAMMQMQKIDIEKLRQAADDETKTVITVHTTLNAPLEKVWKFWTQPEHITKWNNASDDWHTPHAENDLRTGGKFSSRMEAKDGSFGFDFSGVYDEVVEHQIIAYTMDDGRKVQVHFSELDGRTFIIENFEAESTNPVELQKGGWQAILNNFKKYAEGVGQ